MTLQADVMPLSDFPPDMQAEIAEIAARPEPPARLKVFRDENGRALAAIPSRAWYEWHWQRGIDPDGGRKPIPKWIRGAVLERDGLTCQLCGGAVEPDDVHLDHIIPVVRGGQTSVANLQVAHSLCNIRKGAK